MIYKSGIGNAENPEGIGRKATAKRFRTSHFLKVGQFYIDVYNTCKMKGRKILGFYG